MHFLDSLDPWAQILSALGAAGVAWRILRWVVGRFPGLKDGESPDSVERAGRAPLGHPEWSDTEVAIIAPKNGDVVTVPRAYLNSAAFLTTDGPCAPEPGYEAETATKRVEPEPTPDPPGYWVVQRMHEILRKADEHNREILKFCLASDAWDAWILYVRTNQDMMRLDPALPMAFQGVRTLEDRYLKPGTIVGLRYRLE